jgi:hypothetical protein
MDASAKSCFYFLFLFLFIYLGYFDNIFGSLFLHHSGYLCDLFFIWIFLNRLQMKGFHGSNEFVVDLLKEEVRGCRMDEI